MCSIKIWFNWLVLANLVAGAAAGNLFAADANQRIRSEKAKMNVIRTYMDLSEKIDPASIVSMADLEISLSLASTLVTFNGERELVSGLAEKWTITSPQEITFSLRKGLKWSDGSEITAAQYRKALLRAKQLYPNDLKALFDSIESIEAPDASNLVIKTTIEVAKSGIVVKLAEPMYGLVYVNPNGNIDLSKTSGPYYLVPSSKPELLLKANPFWISYTKAMPASIEIRKLPDSGSVIDGFAEDSWANLISDTSLIPKAAAEKFQKLGYQTWQRNLDKVVSIFPSPNFVKNGGNELIKAIAQKIKKSALVEGLAGLQIADQFFPRGYQLWSGTAPKIELSKPFSGSEPVRIIIPPLRSAAPIGKYLPSLVKEITGKVPVFEVLPYNSLDRRVERGEYDLMIVGLAVAGPNIEGSMSFFFEREQSFFPSGPSPHDYAKQVSEARTLPNASERAARMRDIVLKAQEAGYVLPLFHFSSMGVAKAGIDLSGVPVGDETITFSKVRFK